MGYDMDFVIKNPDDSPETIRVLCNDTLNLRKYNRLRGFSLNVRAGSSYGS